MTACHCDDLASDSPSSVRRQSQLKQPSRAHLGSELALVELALGKRT